MRNPITKSKNNSEKNLVFVVIVSLLNPFYLYVKGLVNRDLNLLKYSLPAFYGLLGFTFQLRSESDAYRTVDKFELIIHDLNFSIIEYILYKIQNFRHEGTEIYLDSLSYIVGFFTANWRFLFLMHGIITGIFIFKLLEQVTLYQKNIGKTTFILVSLIIMPVWIMNGRFWLGTIFFAWMVFGHINSGKLKYVLFSFLCVFIHQGLAFAPFLLLIFSFLKGLPIIYYISFYFVSLIYLGTGAEFIGTALNVFSGSVADRIESYGRIDVAESMRETIGQRNENFFIYTFKERFKTILSLLGLFFFSISKMKELADFNIRLIKISFIFFSFYNLTNTIGGLGGRYLGIAHVFGLITLLILFQKVTAPYMRIFVIIGLTFVYAVDFRFDSEQMHLLFPIYGYVQAFIYTPDVTVLELLKGDIWTE